MSLVRIDTPAPLSLRESWIAGQLSKHTARAYAADIRQFLAFVGTEELPSIRREDVFDYRHWLGERYKPATLNRKLSAVRQLFAEALAVGMIERDPTARIKGHRSEGNYSSTRAPSVEQAEALLFSLRGARLPDVRDRAMISLMLWLGLRREEVADLRISSIGEDAGITVLDVEGKGSKRRRIAIPAEAMRFLNEWVVAADATTVDSPMFCELKKRKRGWHVTWKPLTPNGIYGIVKKRMAAVGIVGCSPHSLRHFTATYYLNKGESLYNMQRLMGHADPRTTERYDRNNSGTVNSAAKYAGFEGSDETCQK